MQNGWQKPKRQHTCSDAAKKSDALLCLVLAIFVLAIYFSNYYLNLLLAAVLGIVGSFYPQESQINKVGLFVCKAVVILFFCWRLLFS
ncbi:hypothetical protein IJT10_07650 [bacterium]|nr:hypothetical protein [bacterium]